MHILFDNGTPRQLRRRLFGHDVEMAVERGWDTLTNGILLDRLKKPVLRSSSLADQGHPIPTEHVKQAGGRSRPDEHRVARISRRADAIRNALEGIQPGEVKEVPIPMIGEG